MSLEQYLNHIMEALNTMPRSLDFVDPRGLLRIFKECKVLGPKPSWKLPPEKGDLPGQDTSRVT